jgi:hypothetical protein
MVQLVREPPVSSFETRLTALLRKRGLGGMRHNLDAAEPTIACIQDIAYHNLGRNPGVPGFPIGLAFKPPQSGP